MRSEQAEHFNLGAVLPYGPVYPLGILLSIALFPLFAPDFWHHHFGKVSAFWALLFAVPFLFAYGGTAVHRFCTFIFWIIFPLSFCCESLYTVAGGILLTGTLVGTPSVNTAILFIGTALASGWEPLAAMLLIRPFLRANKHRKNKAFMVCFFIFWSPMSEFLNPIGRPSLFLGFLHSVPFFWTMHLLPHMSLVAFILLVIYFILDRYHYRFEEVQPEVEEKLR